MLLPAIVEVPLLPCVRVVPLPPMAPVELSERTPAPLVAMLDPLSEPVRLSVPALIVVRPVKVFAPAIVEVPLLPCVRVVPLPLMAPVEASERMPAPLVVTLEPLSEPVRLRVPAVIDVGPENVLAPDNVSVLVVRLPSVNPPVSWIVPANVPAVV